MANQWTTEEALKIFTEAWHQLGYPEEDIIDETNIAKLKNLTVEQMQNFVSSVFLIAKQRQFENVFDTKNNPFREFFFDQQDDGWTIQDIMLEILDGFEPYWKDKTDAEVAEGLVKDYTQKVKVNYHIQPYSKQFATTISYKDTPKYFKAGGASKFINSKIGNLTSSAERYLFRTLMCDEIKDMVSDGSAKVIGGDDKFDLNSINGIKHFVERIKVIAKGFTQDTNLYNADGVMSITPDSSYIYIATKSSVLERVKVYLNSGVFNLSETELPNHIIELPEDYDLGQDESGNDIDMIIFDRRAFCIGIRTYEVTNFFVPNQLKWNYFLSLEGVHGHNSFINCVALATGGVGNFLDVGSDTENAYVATIESSLNPISIDGELLSFTVGEYFYAYKFKKSIGMTVNSSLPSIYILYYDKNDEIQYAGNNIISQLSFSDDSGEFIIDMENEKFYLNDNSYDFSNIDIWISGYGYVTLSDIKDKIYSFIIH